MRTKINEMTVEAFNDLELKEELYGMDHEVTQRVRTEWYTLHHLCETLGIKETYWR